MKLLLLLAFVSQPVFALEFDREVPAGTRTQMEGDLAFIGTLTGGGAFMVPSFVALFLLGLPLMWAEWALGRLGGRHGHGTAPGILLTVIRRPHAKYLGALALVGPLLILAYYTYIESWTLAYAWFAFSGQLLQNPEQEAMRSFLLVFQGVKAGTTGDLAQMVVDPVGLPCREDHDYAPVNVGAGHYFGAFFVTRATALPAENVSRVSSSLLSATASASCSSPTKSLDATR